MEFKIEREEKLIDALGYHLLKSNDNRFLIFDDEQNEVGFIEFDNVDEECLKRFGSLDEYDKKFIQYKKLYDNFFKKESFLGYTIKINSNDIYYESIIKKDEQDNFSYEINIKRKDETIDCLVLTLGENASLILKSKNYGNMSFKINQNRLYLNFMSNLENFNVEETVIYEVFDENTFRERKEYTYQIRYCPHKMKGKNDIREIKTCEISGEGFSSSNKIDLVCRSWYNGHMWLNNRNTVLGTIEDLIYKHKKGIDAFNHFRYLINQILPFKEEVISLLCGEQFEKNPLFYSKKEFLKKSKKI